MALVSAPVIHDRNRPKHNEVLLNLAVVFDFVNLYQKHCEIGVFEIHLQAFVVHKLKFKSLS